MILQPVSPLWGPGKLKLAKLVIANKITFQEFVNQYKDWRDNKKICM